MTASLSGEFNTQQLTDLGALGVGLRLYTYVASTTTHKTVYTDAAASVPHSYTSDGIGGQFLALNARGEAPAPLFLTSGGYDLTLKTAAGATIWTRRAHGTNDGFVDLLDADNASKGAGMVGFDPTLSYTGATVGDTLLDMGVPITAFGAVMDSSGASVRTANSAALITAAAANKRVTVPKGTLWVDPSIEIPSSLQLRGAGREVTTIKGDGDLFKITDAAFGTPVFSDLTIANDSTRGKLIRTDVGADIGRVQFERVDFGKSAYHIYAADLCVDWLMIGCRFNDATTASRAFPAGLWAHNEIACYTWYNAIGLDVGVNSSSVNIGGVFEYNTSYAIRLNASSAAAEIAGWSINCHFEGNGSASGVADVLLQTGAVTRIRSIDFSGSRFSTADAGQTIRVDQSVGGGGNLDKIYFGPGTICMGGTAELCPNATAFTVDRAVYFQTLTARATNVVPLTAQSQFTNHLGAYHAVGIANGSSAVLHTITPPSGTTWADIRVQGNSYNGSANAHDGYYVAIYRASGSRITALHNVDHSAGSNQGFAATWTGTAIQIANKAAMTNNQSGDVTVTFYG